MHFLNLIEDNGFEILPISIEHTLTVAKLDFIHRDPFDRILIAQCNTDDLAIVTKDDNIKRYDVSSWAFLEMMLVAKTLGEFCPSFRYPASSRVEIAVYTLVSISKTLSSQPALRAII
jgi:hypothetical protein